MKKHIATVESNYKTSIESDCKTNIKAKTESQVKPVFSSSFIQYWLAQSFDYNRWISELTMLRNIGINEIILQSIADIKTKYAVYPTKIPGYTCNNIDMIETVLSAADFLGMKVRIGLGFSSNWWVMNAFSKCWLNLQASINKTIAVEVLDMYGTHKSFKGWYIPYEISQLTALTKTQQSHLNSFLKQITSKMKSSIKRDIMISPFYNGKFSLLGALPTWSKMLENIFKETKIDIIALQDSIGAKFNTINQLDNLYSYTKKATDALGIKLYATTETFVIKSSEFISAKQESISEQLSAEGKYVEGFVAFSINHYQNKNVLSQENNYKEYHDYYIVNK